MYLEIYNILRMKRKSIEDNSVELDNLIQVHITKLSHSLESGMNMIRTLAKAWRNNGGYAF